MIFDAVRNNKRVVQVFLALITLPFAFWGVDSYVRDSGAGTDLASVGDSKITMQQFDQAWRVQQDRLRQALGANFDAAAVNTPEARLAVLNALVDQRLLLLEASKGRLVASNDQLRDVISKIPGLAGRRPVFDGALSGGARGAGHVAATVRSATASGPHLAAVGGCDWRYRHRR
jgi:peptidyl-prolyl cis-trans isomerase D